MEFRKVLQEELAKLMRIDDKIVIIDADLAKPNGIAPLFKEFPERCFEVGIAEANMVSIAAGLSAYGYKPVIVTFAPFATRRVFDQVAVSVAYAKQNVKIIGTDPGITAELNGGTHMTFADMALMNTIPDMYIYDAVDDVQLKQAVSQIMNCDHSVYVRMPRKGRPTVFDESYKYNFGKADVLKEGKDVTIVASGTMVLEAKKACELLSQKGIDAELISLNTLRPFDEETVLKSIMKTNKVVTCENHSVYGGVFSMITKLACEKYPVKVTSVAVEDFGQVGKYDDLLKVFNLCPENIVEAVEKELK